MTTSQSPVDQAVDAAHALGERVEPKVSDVADTVASTVKQVAAAMGDAAEPVVSNLQHGNRGRKMAGMTMLALLLAVVAVVAIRRRS
jgi:hypothetical protein